jgi:hypothetical protein
MKGNIVFDKFPGYVADIEAVEVGYLDSFA